MIRLARGWAGWLIYAATYLAFGLATAAWQAWLLFLIYAIYYALAEPAEKALVAGLVPAERRGLAFGWFNLVIGIAALPASIVFGSLYQRVGPLAAFGPWRGRRLLGRRRRGLGGDSRLGGGVGCRLRWGFDSLGLLRRRFGGLAR